MVASETIFWNSLEEHFPVWNQAEMDSMKPEDNASERYEDPFGTIMPKYLTNYIDSWKRPDSLVAKNPLVPMIVLDEAGNDTSNNRKVRQSTLRLWNSKSNLHRLTSAQVKGEMFSGNDKGFEWLFAVMMSIISKSEIIKPGDFLWELIYPKDKKSGLPVSNGCGKYYVKCYFMKEWRRVEIDDRIPVDLFGRPLPVGIRPIQLWPLLLTKAILKLMAAFGVLEQYLPSRVPAFTWLTSWPTEATAYPHITNGNGVLYDR